MRVTLLLLFIIKDLTKFKYSTFFSWYSNSFYHRLTKFSYPSPKHPSAVKQIVWHVIDDVRDTPPQKPVWHSVALPLSLYSKNNTNSILESYWVVIVYVIDCLCWLIIFIVYFEYHKRWRLIFFISYCSKNFVYSTTVKLL